MASLLDLLGGFGGGGFSGGPPPPGGPTDLPGLGTIPGMGPDPLASLGGMSTLPPVGDYAGGPGLPDEDAPDLSSAGAMPVPYTPQQTGAPLALGNLLGGLYDGSNPAVNAVSDQLQGERDTARAAAPLPQARPRYTDEDDDDEELFQQPGLKQTLIERGIPGLIAALAGAFGGGQAAATGMLAGSSKGLEEQRAYELEQAKIESARRDRRRAREDTRRQRDWQQMQDRQQAVNSLIQRISDFESPQAAKAWLLSPSVRESYAALGIDTTQMGSVAEPMLQQKIQKEARTRYKDALANIEKLYPNGIPDEVLDKFSVDNFYGKQMTLRQLAEVGGEAMTAGGQHLPFTPKNPASADAIVMQTLQTIYQKTGQWPDAETQRDIAISVNEELAEGRRDPAIAQLLAVKLAGANEARESRDEWAKKYDTQQLGLIRTMIPQYAKGSEEFAQVASYYNQISGQAARALGDEKTGKPGSSIAQVSLIFSYMKMVDPGSAVRSDERATAQNAGGVSARVRNLYNEVFEGNPLSPKVIREILVEAQNAYTDKKEPHDRFARDISQVLLDANINPWTVLRDYNATGDPMEIPGVPRPTKRGITPEGKVYDMGGENDPTRGRTPERGRTPPPGAAAAPGAAVAAPPAVRATKGSAPEGSLIEREGKYYMVANSPEDKAEDGKGFVTYEVEPRGGKWYFTGSDDEAPVLTPGAAPAAGAAPAQSPPQKGEVRKARDGRWLMVLDPPTATEKGRYVEVKVYQTAKGPRWHDAHGRTYKAPVPPEATKAVPAAPGKDTAAAPAAAPDKTSRTAPPVAALPATPKPGQVGKDTTGKTVLVTDKGQKPVTWYPGVGWLLADGSSADQWIKRYREAVRKRADASLLEQ